MPQRIEFGSKAEADTFREEHADYLCSQDDRRLKTVAVVSDAPEHLLEHAEVEAASGRAERSEGAGQLELTSTEKERVGPFTGSNNYRKATAVKARMKQEGVDDWIAFYGPSLTTDEHREIFARAAQEEQGKRLDAE